MIVRVVTSEENPYGMAGTRIHDFSHPDWRQDIDILVSGAGEKLAYITLPKSTCYEDAKTQIEYIQETAKKQVLVERFLFMYLLKLTVHCKM